jgi:hypothetical protein
MALFGRFKSTVAVVNKEQTDVLTFDALVSSTYTGNAQVTDHPIEGVADITDHIRAAPKELQLRGIVSDHPILFLASLRATPSVPGTDPATRAEAAFKFLEGVKDRGELVHVSTSMFDYTDMAITSLSITRDRQTANIADISLTLREILVAKTELIKAPKVGKPTSKGKQVKKQADKTVEKKAQNKKSVLFRLISR